MSDERTVAPSRRRIEQARAEGQVAQSRELTAAAALGATVLAWGMCSRGLSTGLVGMMEESWTRMGAGPPDAEGAARMIASAVVRVLLPVATILGAGFVAAVAAQLLQTGGLFSPGLVMPDTRRLGMLGRGLPEGDDTPGGPAWLGRLAPMGGQVARFLLVGAVLVLTLRAAWPGLMAALERPWPGWLVAAGAVVRQAMGRVAIALLVAGVADYGMQWRRWQVRLSSTPQEHREEQKALEGDPGGRSRRRRTARAMLGQGGEAEGVKEIGTGGVGRV